MPVVIAGLVLSFLVMMLFGDSELDRTLLLLLDGSGLPRLNRVAEIVHWCAQPLPLLAMVGLGASLLAARKRWHDAALLVGLAVAGALLAWGVQQLTLPMRPTTSISPRAGAAYPDLGAMLTTICGFALGFLATVRAPARGWALAAASAFALCAGLAAIMVARAWPSGVVGGWALGLAWTLVILLLARADIGDGARAR